MAGTAQHLAIADRVACLLGEEKIKNLPLFFSGNIAPDAIHARANYERSFKKHTHLTEGLHNGDFVYPDILAIFKKRLDDYIKTYYKKESEEAIERQRIQIATNLLSSSSLTISEIAAVTNLDESEVKKISDEL